MGPSIKSDIIAEYNEKLYRKGEGIFPVPLDKLIGVDVPEDKRHRRQASAARSRSTRSCSSASDMQNHPAMEKLYKDNRGQTVKEDEYEKFFNFVVIDRYVSVNQQQLRGRHRRGRHARLPAEHQADRQLTPSAVNDLTDQLPRHRPRPRRGEVRRAALSDAPDRAPADRRFDEPSCTSSARPWTSCSRTRGTTGDQAAGPGGLLGPGRQRRRYARTFEKLRDEVRFGDPLYVAKPFGKGRVVAFLTSAGAVVERSRRASAGRTTRRS